MKKILSIFSIGSILASGTILSGGGIACGTSATFNLNTIKLNNDIVGIKNKKRTNNEPASITINGKATYTKIENDIINQYNKVFPNKLQTSNFVANSITPTNNKTWALKITNGKIDVTNTTASDLQVWYKKDLASKTNSLSVSITTSDPNVVTKANDSKTKSVSIPLYFNKYVFTGQDVNNDDAINIPSENATLESTGLKQDKVLNLSNYFHFNNLAITSLISQWNNLSGTTLLTIYNDILARVNAKFDTYMTHTSGISKVAKFNATSITENKIKGNKLIVFDVNADDVISLHSDSKGTFARQRDVYIAIPVFNWDYLTNNSYFSNEDTYVYAYLGKTIRKKNLNSFTFENNLITGLTKKARTSDESASITINGHETYYNIVDSIINQYDAFFGGTTLSSSNFILNSTTPTAEKPWALKLTNGNVDVSNISGQPTDLHVYYNQGLASKTNSLNLKITTIDPKIYVSNITNQNNVKSINVPIYFNKYIFNTQDANNDDAINIPNNNATIEDINFDESKILDLSSYNLLNGNTKIQDGVITQMDSLTDKLTATFYNKVLDQINAKFDTYMADEPSPINKLAHFDKTTVIGNIPDNMNFLYFSVSSQGAIAMKSARSKIAKYNSGQKAYIAIPVYDWNYLTNNNYFSNSDTYVYAYLGTAPTP